MAGRSLGLYSVGLGRRWGLGTRGFLTDLVRLGLGNLENRFKFRLKLSRYFTYSICFFRSFFWNFCGFFGFCFWFLMCFCWNGYRDSLILDGFTGNSCSSFSLWNLVCCLWVFGLSWKNIFRSLGGILNRFWGNCSGLSCKYCLFLYFWLKFKIYDFLKRTPIIQNITLFS